MRIAMKSLGLERLDVIHAGETTWQLAPGIRSVAHSRLLEDVAPLR